jgi:hypothetical protein
VARYSILIRGADFADDAFIFAAHLLEHSPAGIAPGITASGRREHCVTVSKPAELAGIMGAPWIRIGGFLKAEHFD